MYKFLWFPPDFVNTHAWLKSLVTPLLSLHWSGITVRRTQLNSFTHSWDCSSQKMILLLHRRFTVKST